MLQFGNYSIIAFVTAFICGIVTTPMVLDFCKRKGLYDMPGKRKVHKNAIPRLGGIVYLPSVLLGCIAVFVFAKSTNTTTISLSLWTVYFIIGVSMIYTVGIIDDILNLGAITKMAVQIIAATMLPLSNLWINNLYGLFGIYEVPYCIGAPLTIIAVTFISNALNLIDGIDGLAASLSIMILGGYAFAFFHWELWYYAIIICALIGVLMSFLYYNMFGGYKHNRKIFMGDTGSLTIGYIIAFLSLKLIMKNTSVLQSSSHEMLLVMTLNIVPALDVIRVAALRIHKGFSPMRADKNHIHHKLLRLGLSGHKTLLAIITISVVFIVLNYILYESFSLTSILITDIILYIVLHIIINYSNKQKGNNIYEF